MIWNNVVDILPTKENKYAGEFGISVIGCDMEDYRPIPMNVIFNFEHNIFLSHATGLNDPIYGDWLPIHITHWMEYPSLPGEEKCPVCGQPLEIKFYTQCNNEHCWELEK